MNATLVTLYCGTCNTQATAPRLPAGATPPRAGWFCGGSRNHRPQQTECPGVACPRCGDQHSWTATPPRGSAAYLEELTAK